MRLYILHSQVFARRNWESTCVKFVWRSPLQHPLRLEPKSNMASPRSIKKISPSSSSSPPAVGHTRKMSAKAQTWFATATNERAILNFKIPNGLLIHPSILSSLATNFGSVLDYPRHCGLLTDVEIAITENYDARDLLEAMASKTLTSLAVTTAFCML